MKKFLFIIMIIFLIVIGNSHPAKAENDKPCRTIKEHCPNGVSYTAIVCDYMDYIFWDEFYCGLSPE